MLDNVFQHCTLLYPVYVFDGFVNGYFVCFFFFSSSSVLYLNSFAQCVQCYYIRRLQSKFNSINKLKPGYSTHSILIRLHESRLTEAMANYNIIVKRREREREMKAKDLYLLSEKKHMSSCQDG